MNKYLNLNKSFINGEWVNGDEGKSVDLVNPYNDDVLAKVELASINQVNEAFTGARNVQKSWGHDSENRKAVMKQAVEYFKNNKEAIMELLTLESGSTQVKADRKSTRLNSSHVANSYAVFCLKKKSIK